MAALRNVEQGRDLAGATIANPHEVPPAPDEGPVVGTVAPVAAAVAVVITTVEARRLVVKDRLLVPLLHLRRPHAREVVEGKPRGLSARAGVQSGASRPTPSGVRKTSPRGVARTAARKHVARLLTFPVGDAAAAAPLVGGTRVEARLLDAEEGRLRLGRCALCGPRAGRHHARLCAAAAATVGAVAAVVVAPQVQVAPEVMGAAA